MAASEIKDGLGWGGLSRIAEKLGVTQPHVSQVVHGKRRSPRVERAVARQLRKKVAEVFPVTRTSAA